EHVAYAKEVAERLRHLLVIDVHESVVHPHLRERVVGCSAGLGNLVLVMRELEVHSAAVNVEPRSKEVVAHRRAFDVPSRPPIAPRRGPVRLARLGALPQHEIERIALRIVDGNACARAQVAELFARELAVALELRDGVHHVAVACDVRIPLLDQLLRHRDDARNVLRRARLVIRPQDPEPVVVLVHRLDESIGQLAHALAVLRRSRDDLVVDVGDVADEDHLVAFVGEIAPYDVERDLRTCVPDVTVVIDGIAAHVHAHDAVDEPLEGFFATGQRMEALHVASATDHLAICSARSRRLETSSLAMSASSGASSGPCVAPVSAARSGMKRAGPFLPQALPTSRTICLKSAPPRANTSRAQAKKLVPASRIAALASGAISSSVPNTTCAQRATSSGNSTLGRTASRKLARRSSSIPCGSCAAVHARKASRDNCATPSFCQWRS